MGAGSARKFGEGVGSVVGFFAPCVGSIERRDCFVTVFLAMTSKAGVLIRDLFIAGSRIAYSVGTVVPTSVSKFFIDKIIKILYNLLTSSK